MSIDNFAHRKGVTRAIQEFRERKEKKRIETAKALREYSKAMKQTGFVPGKGASRKRSLEDNEDVHKTTNEIVGNEDAVVVAVNHEKGEEKVEEESGIRMNKEETVNIHLQRRPRTHLFQKSVEKAIEQKNAKERKRLEYQKSEEDRKRKLKERRERTKLLSQRTRKGQPVMKNIVQDILNRLESNKES